MIKIRLNDEAITIAANQTLLTLLQSKGYDQPYYAIAMNHCFVAQSQHATTIVEENDVIDIVTPMQGG